jgi:hypothetical protein
MNTPLSSLERGRYERLLADGTLKMERLTWRLQLSNQFGLLMLKAFNALRSYGVDYTKLRSYSLWDSVAWFKGTDDPVARAAMDRWAMEIGHDIDAAIRRKSLHQVDLDNA